MTLPVFWSDNLPTEHRATLGGAEGHHAARVRRLQRSEEFLLTDGRGSSARCVVVDVHGGELAYEVRGSVTRQPPPEPRLTVVQALPKGDRGTLAVELAVELGADEVVPWSASRCVTQWRGERGVKAWRKWGSTAYEAAKQSRRVWFPQVTGLASTTEVTHRIRVSTGSRADGFQNSIASVNHCAFVLHEEVTSPLASAPIPTTGEILLIVGPEGGITPDELKSLVDAGAVPVRLGSEVLRTSTTAAAALAAISSKTRWV